MVDGASYWQRFTGGSSCRCRLPAIVTTSVFTFLNAYNDFLGQLIYLTDLDRMTVPARPPDVPRLRRRPVVVRRPVRDGPCSPSGRCSASSSPRSAAGAGHRDPGLQVGSAMASVVLDNLTKRYGNGVITAVNELTPRHRRRRVPGAGRPFGLRQVDGAPDDRRSRGDHRRHGRDRRRGRQRRPRQGPRHRHGVPELRALPAHERLRQHRLRAADRQAAAGRDRRRGCSTSARILRARGLSRPPARPALRRPAPARRDGPRDRPLARRSS